jgi:hypothetical protein
VSISREAFEARFASYDCRLRADYGAGLELWETGWGEGFTFQTRDGFDEDDCKLFALRITQSIPVEWRTASEVFRMRVAIEELTAEIRGLRRDLRKDS